MIDPSFILVAMLFPRNLKTFFNLKCIRCQHAKAAAKPNLGEWESVIGLEIHAQLNAQSKLFSSSENVYGAPVNSKVTLFDAAIPGTLPVLNKRCVEAAVLSSLALKCQINPVSYFDRKHYFYADLPAGYQITQQRLPIAVNGSVSYTVVAPQNKVKIYSKVSRIKQVQLEQDSGKSMHNKKHGISFIDLNRANVGLIEIVFEPDINDAEEAAGLVSEILIILERAGTCTCKMEEGVLRVDANVSVHKKGTPLGTRTEIKNIGSIRGVVNAINFEIERQLKIIKNGGVVVNETLGWDATTDETFLMREKEDKHDYRFMPEPNLPPLRIIVDEDSKNFHEGVQHWDNVFNFKYLKEMIPKSPHDDREFLVEKYKVLEDHALKLVNNEPEHKLFLEVMKGDENRIGRKVYTVIHIGLLSALKKKDLDLKDCSIDPVIAGKICDYFINKKINLTSCSVIFGELINGSASTVEDIIREEDLLSITDIPHLEKICNEVLDAWPKNVTKYLNGRTDYIEHLKRRAAQATDKKADSQLLEDILIRLLEERRFNRKK